MRCFLTATAADPPTDLTVEPVGPTSIRVSWTAPTSVATVTGYRIYYQAEGDSGSVPVNAGVTSYTLGNLQDHTYSITMVTLSIHLPSSVVGPEAVTLGKSLYLHIPSMFFDSYEYVWYPLDRAFDTIPSSNLITRPFQFNTLFLISLSFLSASIFSIQIFPYTYSACHKGLLPLTFDLPLLT